MKFEMRWEIGIGFPSWLEKIHDYVWSPEEEQEDD